MKIDISLIQAFGKAIPMKQNLVNRLCDRLPLEILPQFSLFFRSSFDAGLVFTVFEGQVAQDQLIRIQHDINMEESGRSD